MHYCTQMWTVNESRCCLFVEQLMMFSLQTILDAADKLMNKVDAFLSHSTTL